MNRVITYTARRSQSGLDLDDLERIIDDVKALGASMFTRPIVEVTPARPGQRTGKIHRVRIEG
jgi:hypothetical protein